MIERAAAEVFAERGYRGASMDEIAAPIGRLGAGRLRPLRLQSRTSTSTCSSATTPACARSGAEHLAGDARSISACRGPSTRGFSYLEEHPYAARLLFADTTGDPAVAARHRDVQARSRALALPFLAREPGAEDIAGSADPEAMEMAWEVFRAVLQGLALWWNEHPHVPRAQVVATAMNALWIGFERVGRGERWGP